MKLLPKIVIILTLSLLVLDCKKKQTNWSQADKDKWLEKCHTTFVDKIKREDDKAKLKDLCDCMLKVTSRDYTIEEAANLSIDQESKIMQDCNYNW